MKSGDTFVFTVRPTIKSEPRITQERIYVTPFELRIIGSWNLFYSLEKDKDKKADKELLKFYKTQMYKISHNREYFECFTDDSIYLKCLGKFVSSKEGWYNLKQKIFSI